MLKNQKVKKFAQIVHRTSHITEASESTGECCDCSLLAASGFCRFHMEDISRAVQSARYNEAVIVDVEGQEIVLVATVDQSSGGLVWQDATSPSSGEKNVAILRHLRTKSWMLPMLNDVTRNEFYQAAIRKACQALPILAEELVDSEINILDIGSGTGLLAMIGYKFATGVLQSTAKKVKVVSLEMASAMARVARETVTANGFDPGEIQIRDVHSCEMPPLHPKAIFCTSELLESALLGEGILPALRDAWDRHLTPNAVVVPQRARVYAQILHNKEWIGAYAGPATQQSLGDGDTSLRLSISSSDEPLLCSAGGVLVPVHARFLLCHADTRVLSKPTMVMDFNFSSQASIPGIEGRSRRHSVSIQESGTAHGVLFWWELDLWNDITYSTECGKQQWQDHWRQCLYVFTAPIDVQKDTDVYLDCHHTDVSLSFTLGHHQHVTKRPRNISEQAPITPFRAAVLSDVSRLQTMHDAISKTLKSLDKGALVLDLSDFSLCSMLAALAGATHVISVESSSGALPILSAQVAQIANRLPREGSTFEIFQCHCDNLSLELLCGVPASLVLSEPYYEVLEGWHLQEAINYFYLLKSMKLRGLVALDFVSLPSCARVMGCAIESNAIHGAYKKCGDESEYLCGLDHSFVNQHAARYHENELWIPLWQYESKEITESFEVAMLNYNTLEIEGNGIFRDASFVASDCVNCHGFKFWIEYDFLDTKTSVLSTRGPPYHQGVKLLSSPCTVVAGQIFQCRLIVGGDFPDHEVHRIEFQVVPSETTT
jgi:protein arginine N-methyltransferase 7